MRSMAAWLLLVAMVHLASTSRSIIMEVQASLMVWVKGSNREFRNARDATTAPPYSADYEYIIVGGRTAGCALAATLSERHEVLLLERGGTPYRNPSIERLEGWGDLLVGHGPGSSATTGPVQAFRSADGVHNRRARVLGGGSAINAGFYSRASGATVKSAGWDASLVEASYEWVEAKVVHKPPLQVWHTALKDGLVEAGVAPDNGRTYEHVVGTKVGASVFDAHGRRHSAADLLGYANDELLTVLTFANVHRVIFNVPGPTVQPRAKGVEYTDSNGDTHVVRLKNGSGNEVILSAGALGSPQLLLLSGVGPCDHLAEFNITCLVDLAAVGADMVDNPINAVIVTSPRPVEISLISVAGITAEGNIIEGASGGNWTLQWPAMGQLNIVAPSARADETLESVQRHLRSLPDSVKQQIDQSGFILTKIYAPISKGNLRLETTDVTKNPYVKFNYYSHPQDIKTCMVGVNYLLKLMNSSAFSSFKYDVVTPVIALLYPNLGIPIGHKFLGSRLPDLKNTTDATQWCKDTVTTIWHFHGGCLLGKVVDKRYQVRGVRSLRVVDGSTFTESPGTNPQATVMMLGRYMGVNIINKRAERHKR